MHLSFNLSSTTEKGRAIDTSASSCDLRSELRFFVNFSPASTKCVNIFLLLRNSLLIYYFTKIKRASSKSRWPMCPNILHQSNFKRCSTKMKYSAISIRKSFLELKAEIIHQNFQLLPIPYYYFVPFFKKKKKWQQLPMNILKENVKCGITKGSWPKNKTSTFLTQISS